ncbi:MAG: GlxA family transcriptional regulator [Pseudomonadota bacterium]
MSNRLQNGKSKTGPESFHIGMLMLGRFNAMASMAFIDPFRAANYLQGANFYTWDFLGHENSTLSASNGLEINALTEISESHVDAANMLVINASWGVEEIRSRVLFALIRKFAQKGNPLCGIDTGAFVLAYSGLMEGRRATVHYEHIAAFRELYPQTEVVEEIFVIDENLFTCCGGLAASDLALQIIRNHHGVELANASARYIFHGRLRGNDEGQLPDKYEPVGYTPPLNLRRAINLMEENLEQPLDIQKIASLTNLSQRQLERLFHKHTGISPVRFYLNSRLDRARGLITQTDLAILDVAIACGFSGNSHFTRAYKSRFDITPSQDRVEGRKPFRFRSFPSFSGL